jgi:Sec-independent protein secretion pathway component TatC
MRIGYLMLPLTLVPDCSRADCRHSKERHEFVRTVVATVATPSSDVISMSIMAVSMYLLYEVSLFCARFFLKM